MIRMVLKVVRWWRELGVVLDIKSVMCCASVTWRKAFVSLPTRD